MRSILRVLILAPAVIAAAALATNPAMAETTTIKVPFNFKVAGKDCPAGSYSVKHDDTGNFVTLVSQSSSQSFTWVLGPGSPGPSEKKIALKFDELGPNHVLQSVQLGTQITSRLDKKVIESEHESDRLSGGR